MPESADTGRDLRRQGAKADLLLLCALDDRERIRSRLTEGPALVNRRFEFDTDSGPHAYHLARMGWGRNTPIDAVQAALNSDRRDLLRYLVLSGAEFTLDHWGLLFPKGHRALDETLTVLSAAGVDINGPRQASTAKMPRP